MKIVLDTSKAIGDGSDKGDYGNTGKMRMAERMTERMAMFKKMTRAKRIRKKRGITTRGKQEVSLFRVSQNEF